MGGQQPRVARLPRVFGPFQLVKRIGEGAVGEVHLARNLSAPAAPDVLVIKTIHTWLSDSAERMQRFRHEARIAVSVDSPHVVKVYDVGTVDRVPYIAMEHVAGWSISETLQTYAQLGEPPPLATAVRLARDGLRGLMALHEAVDPDSQSPLDAVHRDVSPRNVMIHRDGRLLLIDLGLGRSNLQDWRTRAGALMGTLGYMAPEQAASGRVDHRADLYSMAVIFYELLTLRRYIQKGDPPAMIARMQAPSFIPPTVQRPGLPPELDGLLARALALRPEDRFASAREFLAAIDELDLITYDDTGSLALPRELFDRLAAEERELEELLEQAATEYSALPQAEGTVVFASRGLPLYGEEQTRASAIVVPAPFNTTVSVTLAPDATPTQPGVDKELATEALMTAELSATIRRPITEDLRLRPAPRRAWAAPVLAGVAALLGVALAVLMRRQEEAPPAPIPVPVTKAGEEPPRAEPRPAAERRELPPSPSPVPEDSSAPTAAASDRPRPAPARARPDDPPRARPEAAAKVVAPVVTLGARFQLVLREAAALKRRHPDRAGALDELLTDASLWSESSDPDKQARALEALERRLAQLR